MPFQMMRLAHEHGIQIRYWNFKPPIEAIYYYSPGVTPTIGLSKNLLKSRPHFRSVFAEELGHHFTTKKQNLTQTYFHTTHSIYEFSYEEYQARQWGAKFLIPDNELRSVIRQRVYDFKELMDMFCVDEELLSFRLDLYHREYEAIAKPPIMRWRQLSLF